MHFHLLNLYSALGIGVVITGMAMIPDIKTKALIYVLPIPISIGLIATHGTVTSSNLIGLMLIWVFMLTTRLLADNLRLPIVAADIVASVLYILLGYYLIRTIHWPFWVTTVVFVGLWCGIIGWLHAHPVPEKPPQPSALPATLKGGIAAVISFAIYSFKDRLAGIVVTFPYNGVFAVVEVRHHLQVFIRSVVRNTLAIAGLFVTMHYCHAVLSLPVNFVAGWLVFGFVLLLVQRISV